MKYSLCETLLHLRVALGHNSGQQDEGKSSGTALLSFSLSTSKMVRMADVCSHEIRGMR